MYLLNISWFVYNNLFMVFFKLFILIAVIVEKTKWIAWIKSCQRIITKPREIVLIHQKILIQKSLKGNQIYLQIREEFFSRWYRTDKKSRKMIKKKYKITTKKDRNKSTKINFEVDIALEPYWTISKNCLYYIFCQSQIWRENFLKSCIADTHKKNKDRKKNIYTDDKK